MGAFFKVIQELLTHPAFAGWVSFTALAVSCLSLIVNKRSLAHAKAQSQAGALLEATKAKCELLCALSNEKNMLMECHLEVGTELFRHQADPDSIKAVLQNYQGVFEFFPQIETYLHLLDDRYSQVSAMDDSIGAARFVQIQAEQHKISMDMDHFKRCCLGALNTFREKRDQAVITCLPPPWSPVE